MNAAPGPLFRPGSGPLSQDRTEPEGASFRRRHNQATFKEDSMKKLVTGALASLTAAGALAASVPASARDWDDHHWRHHDNSGAAVAAGIAGLAIGAALASSNDHYYGGSYYYDRPAYYYDAPPPAYYAGPTYYGYYHRCHAQWRWDPYWGRYVRVRACY